VGCMVDDFDGITIHDQLREMLVNDESEISQAISQRDRKEFLFHLLRLIAVGGSMCQAEYQFRALKEAVRMFYKDLVSVHKSSTSGKIEITSTVYHIDPHGSNLALFPVASVHNKCYVLIEKATSTATIIYKPFEPFW